MSFNVRLFGYSGIIQVGQPNADQFSGGAVFLNEEPCLWSQILVCDGSTVATSARITTVPDGTQMVCVEVPDGHEIRYEVVQPGVAARAVSSDSRRGSGSFNLAWSAGYSLSIIDAVPVAVVVVPPSAPPSSLTGLIGWWDASVFASLTLSGGVTVTAIADQSGAGNNLTGVGTPRYGASLFNSLPGIGYDSTEGDGLIKSSLALGTGNTLTLFAAMFMNDPAVNGIGQPAFIFSYTASGAAHDYDNVGSFNVERELNNANVKFFRNSVTSTARTLGYATNRRVIVTVKSDGTWTTYVDGVAVADTKIANNWVSPGYFGLGISKNDSSVFQQFGGVFAEAGLATGYHDATAVAALDTYLKNKWGL